MSRFLIISLLFLASCSGSVRVSKNIPKHGAVPETNPARVDNVSVDIYSSTAFFSFLYSNSAGCYVYHVPNI